MNFLLYVRTKMFSVCFRRNLQSRSSRDFYLVRALRVSSFTFTACLLHVIHVRLCFDVDRLCYCGGSIALIARSITCEKRLARNRRNTKNTNIERKILRQEKIALFYGEIEKVEVPRGQARVQAPVP